MEEEVLVTEEQKKNTYTELITFAKLYNFKKFKLSGLYLLLKN